jgi:hypothetical protein
MISYFLRQKFVVILCIAIVLLVFGVAACSKGPFSGKPGIKGMPTFPCKFQADFTQTMVKNGVTSPGISGKTYTNCELYRMETRTEQPGAPAFTMIVISRPDLGVTWQLFPKSMKYVERAIKPPTPGGPPPVVNPKDIKIDAEKLGEETVSGHPCIKWKVTMTMPDGKSTVYYSWGAQDLENFEIKKEFQNAPGESMVFEYSNVVLGDPDKSVFEIPAGYTKASEGELSMLMMKEMGIALPPGISIPPVGNQ